jgi:serine protease inhibitor
LEYGVISSSPPPSPVQDTAALLVNAVYFKGGWASPFKREFTVTRRFLLDANSSFVETQFMYREGKVLLGRHPSYFYFDHSFFYFYTSYALLSVS